MSKIKLTGNASGTGTLTIAAPNTNTDRTLTLPDGAGEILLSNGDGSNLTGVGKVLQVVSASYSTEESTSSPTIADTSLNATITPSSTANKILVLVSVAARMDSGATSLGVYRIYRGTSSSGTVVTSKHIFSGGSDELKTSIDLMGLDSPSTTSAQTYTLAFAANSSTVRSATDGNPSTITLMEIAG